MAANTGKLAGRVMFISGASRGIGRAIALKAARDGAKIAIAAKTKDPHPKLAGTIFSVAKEIEEAGGQCLPCLVDIRNEDQVKDAVDQTVKAFGGIDILVNNASAISLTTTETTPMKTYDLMNNVNARGTYLCSKYCVPHLMKGTNPHILNLSPPLNMNPKWFKNHVAYTMAKYGMSMCVLGMSEEFRDQGIAVNALWPRTAIYTAAMEMMGGGKSIANQCRKVDIMSDAAYVVLTTPAKESTGNFFIDDEVLIKAGITDMDQYSCHPGSELLPDFFLELDPKFLPKPSTKNVGTIPTPSSGEMSVNKIFGTIRSLISPDVMKTVGVSYIFKLSGSEPGDWVLDLKTGEGFAGKLEGDAAAYDVEMTLNSEDFVQMFQGKLNPTQAFMNGKMKIKGNMMGALKLEKLMKSTRAKL